MALQVESQSEVDCRRVWGFSRIPPGGASAKERATGMAELRVDQLLAFACGTRYMAALNTDHKVEARSLEPRFPYPTGLTNDWSCPGYLITSCERPSPPSLPAEFVESKPTIMVFKGQADKAVAIIQQGLLRYAKDWLEEYKTNRVEIHILLEVMTVRTNCSPPSFKAEVAFRNKK